jgi:hypothetical protein
VIQAEVAFLDVLLIVAVVLGWRMWRSVLAKIIDREKAMDLHAKAVTRDALRATAAAERVSKVSQGMLDDARRLNESAERHSRGG